LLTSTFHPLSHPTSPEHVGCFFSLVSFVPVTPRVAAVALLKRHLIHENRASFS
jgi:hypothetical protein